MPPRFRIYEVVRILSESPQIKKVLTNKEGVIVGMSEPYDDGHRDFGVHINEFGESFALPEQMLESTGRIATEDDIVSRSRAANARRVKSGGNPATESGKP
jgi:hypothetical protein